MNDDGSYSYTWIDTNKNVIVRHLVVNGYEYLPYIGDILWSPNKKHFAFMDKNKVVFVDGEKLNIHVQST